MGRNWLSTATSSSLCSYRAPCGEEERSERELRAESVRSPGGVGGGGVLRHLLRPKQALRGGEHSS